MAYLCLDPGDAERTDQSQDDALAQPEKGQDSDDDDDCADDVDDAVHEMTFSCGLKNRIACLQRFTRIITFCSGMRCALAYIARTVEMGRTDARQEKKPPDKLPGGLNPPTILGGRG